jgi:parallel beta-helix repeat protein
MGWSGSENQRGLELNSPVSIFNNNTLTGNYNGVTLYSGANGSILTSINASSNSYGIYLGTSSNNTLANIIANSNSQHGIYLTSSSNNTLANITANSNIQRGLALSSSSNNTITNITVNSNSYGLWFSGSSNNTLTNIIANSNVVRGIYLGPGFNNTFNNISFWNCPATTSGCIELGQTSNNAFIKGTVNLTRSLLVDMRESNNTLFQDIQFINDTNIPGGINITSSDVNKKSLNNTFLNCSFEGVTEATSANSQLIRQWYMDASTNVLGALIVVRNSSQNVVATANANTRFNLIAYINNSGSVSQWQPYNISAFASGYNPSIDVYPFTALTGNAVKSITLTPACTNDAGCDSAGSFCDGNTPYTCTLGVDGCLDRTNLVACGTGESCQSGVCQAIQQPPSGGTTPGFEPSLVALLIAALVAGLFARI